MSEKLKGVLKVLLAFTLVFNLVAQPVVSVFAKADEENRVAKTYTIEYVDQANNQLAEETTKTTGTDAKVKKSDYEKTIMGYKAPKAELNGVEITEEEIELTDDDNKIKLIYELDSAQDKFEYTIQYVDDKGATLEVDKTTDILKNTDVVLKDINLDDHVYVKSEVKNATAVDGKVKIDKAGIVIKNTYRKAEEFKYTVKYVDDKNVQIPGKNDEEIGVNEGKEVSVKALNVAIDGYTYKETKVDGTATTAEKIIIDKEGIVIEVIYTKNTPVEKVNYTIDYLFNTTKLKKSEVESVDKGAEVDLLAIKNKTIDGYTFKEMKLDGVVTTPIANQKIEKNTKIEYFYTKDEVKKEYTIKLNNKFIPATELGNKKVTAKVGDRVDLKELFKDIPNINNIKFDEQYIYLNEDANVNVLGAVKTTYTLKFTKNPSTDKGSIVLNGFVGEKINLAAKMGEYDKVGGAEEITLDADATKNAAEYKTNGDSNPPTKKTITITYVDENNKSIETSELLDIVEGVKVTVKPKIVANYTAPAEQEADGSKNIEFKYNRAAVEYTIRIVDRDRNAILDREGKYIENKKADGKIGDNYTLVLTDAQKEDLKDYNYNTVVTLGKVPYIEIVATKKSTGGGDGGTSTERVDYKIVHEVRNGKELDVEKGRGKVGDVIKSKKNSYRDYTFYRVDPKDEKMTLVSDEKKNVITYTYEKDSDSSRGGSSSSSSGDRVVRRSSSNSDLARLNKTEHIQYIFGYEDGTVKPEGKVTREEAAMMLYRLTNLEASRATVTFKGYPDVAQNRWSYDAIKTLTELGILTGYDDGTFKPTNAMTRAEVVTMISKYEGLTNSNVDKFSDTKTHWGRIYINSASENRWINGYEDGTFKPNNPVTRAEFANIVNKVLERRVESDGVVSGIKTFKDLKPGKWYYYPLVEATNGHTYTKYPNGREQWGQLK